MKHLLWLVLAVFSWLAAARPASAHELGASKGEYEVTEEGVHIRLNLTPREATMAAGGSSDATPTEEQARKAAEHVSLRRGEATCALGSAKSSVVEKDWVFDLAYPHCGAGGNYVVDLGALIKALRIGHTHAAFIKDPAGERDDTLHAGRATLELAAPATADAPAAPAPAPRSRGEVGFEYFKQGIIHILIGFDHLLFLFGLVIIGGRLKHLLAMVTSFTLAHSITLALAVTGVLEPPGEVIEPLIALSVAYVGIENFLVKDASKRWRLTSLFGLIHGFGFAGALGDLGVPQDHFALALGTFNLGVEAGQLMVMGVVLPLVYLAGKRDWWKTYGVRALSVAVVGMGLFWFVSRVFFSDA